MALGRIVRWTDGRHTVEAVRPRHDLAAQCSVTVVDDEHGATIVEGGDLPPGRPIGFRCGATAVYVGARPGLEHAELVDARPGDVVQVAEPCWLVALPVGQRGSLQLVPGGNVDLASVVLRDAATLHAADVDDDGPAGWIAYP